MPPRLCVVCAVALALALFLLSGPPATAADPVPPVSFIRDVAPVLQENCFACHDAKKRSGKYDMTSYAKLMAGGVSGEAVTPGDPADSEFYTLCATADERRMPPRGKGDPVPAKALAILEAWVKQGAKLDDGVKPDADIVKELRARWQPPTPPAAYTHHAVLNALAFTPDGKSIVTGGHHELLVWSLPAGKLTKRVRTRAERAYAMLFLPSGQLAVAGGRPGQEGDVCIYDLNAGSDGVNDPKVLLARLVTVDDSVLCLSATPDGKWLAAGGCDRTSRVWDLSGGVTSAKLAQTVENHVDWVLAVALSGDGALLASGSRDKTAKVFDLKTRESVLTFPEHRQAVHGVALNRFATFGVSAGADSEVRSWSPASESRQLHVARAADNGDVLKLISHPTLPLFATAGSDKTVRLFEWTNDKFQQKVKLAGLTDHAFAVAFSPDGKLVAGGSYAGEVRLWSVPDGKDAGAFAATPGFAAGK